jgi:hypothetical protein
MGKLPSGTGALRLGPVLCVCAVVSYAIRHLQLAYCARFWTLLEHMAAIVSMLPASTPFSLLYTAAFCRPRAGSAAGGRLNGSVLVARSPVQSGNAGALTPSGEDVL